MAYFCFSNNRVEFKSTRHKRFQREVSSYFSLQFCCWVLLHQIIFFYIIAFICDDDDDDRQQQEEDELTVCTTTASSVKFFFLLVFAVGCVLYFFLIDGLTLLLS